MTKVFIAEKPSMAAEIAANLPGPSRKNDGYFETGGGQVTWLFGHVMEQGEPHDYDPKYKNWNLADLPLIPENWILKVVPDKKKQFNVVKGLLKAASSVVNAGDPDREGQLLVDEVIDYVGVKVPVQRILLNALDEKSVKAALKDLKDNKSFKNLKMSALARQRADWLVGMNITRALTLAARKSGHQGVLAVGRVKSPTMALAVHRELAIRNFVPTAYTIFKGIFAHPAGEFPAVWVPGEDQPGLDPSGRLIDQATAAALSEKFEAGRSTPGKILTYKTEEKKEGQPLPFSLSALQSEAGRVLKYNPDQVLAAAQSLYEKKLTSYPRSDCDYLPENQLSDVSEILQNLSFVNPSFGKICKDSVDPNQKTRAWNNAKVTAHHAIIPTTVKAFSEEGKAIFSLTEQERNIYELIASRFISLFLPPMVFDKTEITLDYSGELFRTGGRTIKDLGWKILYKEEDHDSDKDSIPEDIFLPVMKEGDSVNLSRMQKSDKKTTPPKRFTQTTLLDAMKKIHAFVEDPEVKAKLKSLKGIGTEATRSTIIADLVARDFFSTEKGGYLIPTDKAFLLVEMLPASLTKADTTAAWEDALSQIEEGEGDVDSFLSGLVEFVSEVCSAAGSLEVREVEIPPGLGCPKCGKLLVRRKGSNGFFWGCSGYPDCKNSFPDKAGKPVTVVDPAKVFSCPKCKKDLRLINGPSGSFWGCKGYPDCRASYPDKKGQPDTAPPKGFLCPDCGKDLRQRKGKPGGDPWWGCSGFPGCKKTFKDIKGKPEGIKAA